MFPKQRERHVLHCCWEGHGPKKKTAVGHTGQMAPQAIWGKKKIGGRREKFWTHFRCRTYTVSNVIGKSEINQLLV